MEREDNGRISEEITPPEGGRTDSGLACLLVLARFHDLALDPGQVRHQFGRSDRDLDRIELTRAFNQVGLKSKMVNTSWARLSGYALPALMQLKDGRFCIVGKVSKDEALLQFPGAGRAKAYTRKDVESVWNGTLILAVRRRHRISQGKFGIRWVVQAIGKYRALLQETILASAFIQIFALATPLVFMIVIDKVLSHNSLTTLDVLVFALAVVSFFEILLSALRSYLFSHTTNRVDVQLGTQLFQHLLSLPLSYFESRRVGDTVARMRELESVRQFITGSALTLLLDLFFTVVFLGVMFLFSPFLTFIVIGAIPVFFLISLISTPLMRRKLDDKFVLGAENQSFLVEAISGIETLKSTATEPKMQRDWEERIAEYAKCAFSSGNVSSITNQSIAFVSKAVVVILLWLGAKLVLAGELTVGQLIAFNMLATRVNTPILRIAQIWQQFQQMRISMRRLADILDVPGEPMFKPGRTGLPEIDGRISFEKVTFRYRPDGPEILTDVSFNIEPGEVVGVVGASGSGKTTMVKLLQRLYVPERGRILIDGVDVSLADASWLRRQIGVVAQDSILFNRSVRDNIAFSDPGMGTDRIVEVAKLAGAHDFILELPDGYDTLVGERGGQISAGQRQRLAIARALSIDPRLLILDEATSALDYESEQSIRENMRQICLGRTVFVVAHRLSTVRHADRILTLERGRLIENDSPRVLLSNGGRYAKLHRIQEGYHAAV